jgi:hypothetical protein
LLARLFEQKMDYVSAVNVTIVFLEQGIKIAEAIRKFHEGYLPPG